MDKSYLYGNSVCPEPRPAERLFDCVKNPVRTLPRHLRWRIRRAIFDWFAEVVQLFQFDKDDLELRGSGILDCVLLGLNKERFS